jgi:3'-phosphoadenosine 5'-phosphosulfate sulfotransferase (PAPS reductase)/FAD synthetase
MEIIKKTRTLIERHLAKVQNPAVLCSFGKDSMVTLALLREQNPSIAVAYWPVFDHPTKHLFAQRVIAEWGLNMLHWQPSARDVIGKGQHVELVECYEAEGFAIWLPIEAQAGYAPDADCLCAIERLVSPLGTGLSGIDGIFIGHRGDDIDPTHGPIPLDADEFSEKGRCLFYPLFDWTEKDIWEASKLLNIPQNLRRYRDASLAHNADYFDLCTQCLTPGMKGPMVPCPKGGEVFNLGRHLDLDARREALRSRFVNIASDLSKSY